MINDQAIFLDEDTIAYVNPYPGTLVERCADEDPNNLQLMPYGMIHLNASCQYEMLNGPLTNDDSYISRLIVTNAVENPAIIIKEIDEPAILKNHFQEYAIPYLASLAGSILSLLTSLFCYCCCKKKIAQCCSCLTILTRIRQRSRAVQQP
jgi:hypothetical protein